MDVDLNGLFNKTQLSWLKDNTIFVTLHGSHAYGTNHIGSDIDLKGVAIPPKQVLFGFLDNFEQAEFNEPYDAVIYDIRKFCKLAAECNPNIIELLFSDESSAFIKKPPMQRLMDIRDAFISKKARYTFAGYAHAQIKRIKTHRRWLLNPITKKPERSDYKLPDNHKLLPEHQLKEIEAAISKKLDGWILDTTGVERARAIEIKSTLEDILVEIKVNSEDLATLAARSYGLNDNIIEAFKRERQYKNALSDYNNYKNWQHTRNKSRAELESKFNYDVKHGMHLVRLYKMCEEIITTGKVIVKRPDAEELLAIRNGAWTYDELIEFAEKQDEKLNELYESSKLPREPNRKLINSTLIDILDKSL